MRLPVEQAAVANDRSRSRVEPERAGQVEAERPQESPGGRGPTSSSSSGYLSIVKRAFKRFRRDHMTNIAAALAYYAFLAIPSALLIAVGVFSLLAGPHAISSVIGKLGRVMPGQATSLLSGSLTTMTHSHSAGITVLSVGAVLALWSLTGAMQNVIWAANIAYEREETRGFIRRRMVALVMLGFGLLGFALCFGVLVLGPHLSHWVGSAVGARRLTTIVWWVAEWPILLAGLMIAFAGLMFFAPNAGHRRWSFVSVGAVVAIVLWLVASGLFSFYVSRFGHYNKTWGSLSAVVVMLTWLWISAVALLLGAEINAESERSRAVPSGRTAPRTLEASNET